jgi:hypothetical protein
MTPSCPEPYEPGHAPELPTTAAHVDIQKTSGGAWVKVRAWRWLTGEGNVPPGEARYLIAMIGTVSCVVSGIGGAVLIPGSAPERAPVVFAALGLALVGAVLVAVGYFRRETPDGGRAPQEPDKPAVAREQTKVR